MADLGGYMQPGAVPGTVQDPGAPGVDLQPSWYDILKQKLANPAVQAGLLQAGINLMQPQPLQQTNLGAIGSAIGAGAGAYNRNVAEQQRQTDTAFNEQVKQQQLANEAEQNRVALEGHRMQLEGTKYGADIRSEIAQNVNETRLAITKLAGQFGVAAKGQAAINTNYDMFRLLHPGETFDILGAVKEQKQIQEGLAPDTGGVAPGAPGEPPTQTLQGTKVPTITTREQYDALPSGSQYLDSQGRLGTKR